MYVVDKLIIEATAAQSYKINAAISCRLFSSNDERRYVLAETASALYHNISAYVAELMAKNFRAYYCVIVNGYLTTEFSGVCYDATVTNNTIMCNVYILHEQVIGTYFGSTL